MLLFLTLLACDPAPMQLAAAPAVAPAAPVAAAPVAPAPTASAPAASAPDAATEGTLTGVVAETIAAGPYTYTRATLADGTDAWAAATGAAPVVGSTITIATSLPMRDFRSDSLDRTFPLVYFVSGYGGDGALTVPTTGTALPAGHPDIGAPG